MASHSTPEAAWAFSSAKILGDYVNRWRAAEGFDYSTFLTNPNPVSMAAYINTPPFCYTDAQAALVHGRAPPTCVTTLPAVLALQQLNSFSTDTSKPLSTTSDHSTHTSISVGTARRRWGAA